MPNLVGLDGPNGLWTPSWRRLSRFYTLITTHFTVQRVITIYLHHAASGCIGRWISETRSLCTSSASAHELILGMLTRDGMAIHRKHHAGARPQMTRTSQTRWLSEVMRGVPSCTRRARASARNHGATPTTGWKRNIYRRSVTGPSLVSHPECGCSA